jgi:hypothetical protein
MTMLRERKDKKLRVKKGTIGGRSLSIVRYYFPKVTKVTDADKPIEVEVTQHDNEHSQVRNHNTCAMAVACKRTMKCDGVIISLKSAYLIRGTEAIRYFVPESVSREEVSFDRKAGFDPGMYRLVPNSPGARIGARSGRKEPEGERTGDLKRQFKHFTTGVRAALGSKRAPDGIHRG